jgi:uncharacterized protein (TIGR02328 family)
MRIWSKQLISVLPREQLVSQWRELSAIAGAIQKNGTPNHILVNKVCQYSWNHFISYAYWLRQEMTKRGYKTMDSVWNKIISLDPNFMLLSFDKIYHDWHNERYLRQCYFNLQEKYDCGGIDQNDWLRIYQSIPYNWRGTYE